MADGGFQKIRMQRSQGEAALSVACRDGHPRLGLLRQRGSAKIMLPHVAGPVPEAVFLNTSGGLTGGDRLGFDLNLGAGVSLCATTQTAERAYASGGTAATVRICARLDSDAELAWLPQETILFEHSMLQRETTVYLTGSARLLLAESVILGRHAMGEAPLHAQLTDRRRILRDGRPVWAETTRIDSRVLAEAATPALLGDARAFAVLALIAPGAEAALPRLRAELCEPGVEAAASGWNGRCIARLRARDGWPLKRQLARAIRALRPGPLPRVWQMNGDIA